jgi:hypothetical protein
MGSRRMANLGHLSSSTRFIAMGMSVLSTCAIASCQLLLPDGNGTGGDASSSTSGRGGASASSSSKTTSAKSSNSGSEVTASSSTGGIECTPGGTPCVEAATFVGCATESICPGNANCSGYCSEIKKCTDANLAQYGTPAECCGVCEFALNVSDTTNSLCCRADGLNQGANHSHCTTAGPFGVSGANVGSCGAQNIHVCDLLFTVCAAQTPGNCTKQQCEAVYQGSTTNQYIFGADGNDAIGKLMDAAVTAIDAPNKPEACATAFEMVCPTVSAAVATSGGG